MAKVRPKSPDSPWLPPECWMDLPPVPASGTPLTPRPGRSSSPASLPQTIPPETPTASAISSVLSTTRPVVASSTCTARQPVRTTWSPVTRGAVSERSATSVRHRSAPVSSTAVTHPLPGGHGSKSQSRAG